MFTDKCKKTLRIWILKFLLTIVVLLVLLILFKGNSDFKTKFYKLVYEDNFTFTKVKGLYNKYIGTIIKDKEATSLVFNEQIEYSKKESYKDGVKLYINNNSNVISRKSGLVVYIGEKEGYNNTVIIQGVDEVDIWYGNIDNTSVKLYDYVEENSIIGTSNDYIYLVYKKNGKVLNYEEYLK